MLKSKFRPLLLEKMLKTPRSKETPLADSVREVIVKTDTTPIIDYVRRGIGFLRSRA